MLHLAQMVVFFLRTRRGMHQMYPNMFMFVSVVVNGKD